MDESLILAGLFLAAAILYGMVGHAGASAYLAAMGLLGVAPEVMKPTALTLNILVASIVTYRFARAGFVRPLSAVPFLIGSVPAAFVGGAVTLPGDVYRPLVGVVLLFAAFRFGLTAGRPMEEFAPRAPLFLAVVSGAVIGLLAGLTGTGGGIFLTPLLIAAGWAGTRYAAGTSAIFILANSVSGLAGNFGAVGNIPAAIPLWLAVVAVGGAVGSELGSRRLPAPWVRRGLAVVLLVAGLKLIFVP
ncbi:MAG TPA: sulfite exporter TauE/SafE family protein [Candidatus Limnocylindrales bacterium]|nr:sulfite exporter TauE/SafE family protein [Candidatus Limnocylindrales bacterium]